MRPERRLRLDSRKLDRQRGASTPGRIAAVLALLVAIGVAVVLLFSGDEGHKYTLLFKTGGQLVPGNEVLVAGQRVGMVDSIDLTEDNQAAVRVTMNEPLREGTTAIIRSTSLSGVANRYISLTPGPNNEPDIPDDETITGTDTTSPVDLDQLFNVFGKKERAGLQKFIRGNATAYAGKAKLANRAYKFLNPSLSTSEKLFAELTSDSVALERFLVAGSKTFGALADRRTDLTSLISNANTTLQAIANRNDDLDTALAYLPDTLRQGNTTFVNLRAALDDLDPLVQASYPATKNLAPFLRRLRLVSEAGVPVFSDLGQIVALPGAHNDLADTLQDLPELQKVGRTAWPSAVDAMNATQAEVQFLRPYMPDLMAFLTNFGQVSAYYDGNSHYARIQPSASNVFSYNGGANTLDPQYTNPAAQWDQIQTLNPVARCPGGGSAPAPDGSNPFLDNGLLGPGDCNPADIPPGP